jgi:hypothetical protein
MGTTVFLVRFGQVAWDEWFVACGHPTIKDSGFDSTLA